MKLLIHFQTSTAVLYEDFEPRSFEPETSSIKDMDK